MALIAAKCTQCNAPLQVDDSKPTCTCDYCGTTFMTEQLTNTAGTGRSRESLETERSMEGSGENGKMLSGVFFTQEQLRRIEEMLRRGQKIEAIKEARELTGLGLKEAMDLVENYAAELGISQIPSGSAKKSGSAPKSGSVKKSGSASKSSSGAKGGCYIATCVYGSYDCPQVWTLRRFRDDTLDATWYGKAFIRCYYAVSPTLVKWFGQTKWFRGFWKKHLDRMVEKLHQKGVEDTRYTDKY